MRTFRGSVPKPGGFMFALRYTAYSGWSRTNNSLRGTGFRSLPLQGCLEAESAPVKSYESELMSSLVWLILSQKQRKASTQQSQRHIKNALEHKLHTALTDVVDVQHHGRKGWCFGPSWHRGIVEVSWLNPMRVSAVLTNLKCVSDSWRITIAL